MSTIDFVDFKNKSKKVSLKLTKVNADFKVKKAHTFEDLKDRINSDLVERLKNIPGRFEVNNEFIEIKFAKGGFIPAVLIRETETGELKLISLKSIIPEIEDGYML